MIDIQATNDTRARYRRLAPIYDLLETMAEKSYTPWRHRLWDQAIAGLAPSGRLLEVGVGTGKNISFWPRHAQIVAVDLTPEMLEKAKQKVAQKGITADLSVGDTQSLRFDDDSFDLAAATFVFCSVPDPVLGLRELKRVVKPGGSVLLMEHVRSQNPLVGRLMDILAPVVVRLMGAYINRDTVANVKLAGLEIEDVEDLGAGGIFKLIRARVPK